VDFLDCPVTEAEIFKVIKSKKGNTAPGHDGVPMEVFKKFASQLVHPLALLFNKIFDSGHYPKEWSLALIFPLFKKSGSPNDPNNYRPISLLPCLSKIFTKVIANRLIKWASSENVVSEFQAGFRPGKSTVDQMFILQHFVDSSRR